MKHLSLCCALLALLSCRSTASVNAGYSLEFPAQGDGRTLEICPGPEKPVRVSIGGMPVRGKFISDGECARFQARFHFAPGTEYLVRFAEGKTLSVTPGPEEPSMVRAVYPTSDVLPENLLRFYVYFSQPMREGESSRHLRLLEASGQEVAGAFLSPVRELWDPSLRRLTVILDPSRVKTGLESNKNLGRALRQDSAYILEILPGWRDANGNRTSQNYEKRFRVSSEDFSPPDVSLWKLTAPGPGTRDALSVRFPDILDHGCLLDFLRVLAPDGSVLSGQILMEEHETLWKFVPDGSWEPGEYFLAADPRLEDPAGNNLNGLFDRPAKAERTNISEPLRLSFQI